MKQSKSAMMERPLGKVELGQANRKPLAYAKSLAFPDLCRTIRWANRLYYDDGTSVLSDEAYDALTDQLRLKKPSHPLLTQVGTGNKPAPAVKGAPKMVRTKVKLPYPLFSLGKIKPGTGGVEDWSKKFPGPYAASNKMDGCSLEIVYPDKKGQPVKAYSRGDGTLGQDVSHIVPFLNVPQTSTVPGLCVRGEAIMSNQKFKQFATEYENPRNLVTGVVNKLGQHKALGHIHFVAYEIINPRKYKPSQAFAQLKSWGFQVAPWEVLKAVDSITLSNLLVARKQKSQYDIDGLVVEQDAVHKRPQAGTHAPDYAVAFKMTSEDDVKEVRVLGIDWNDSKHGKIIPRVNIEPTRLSGVTVNWANGHNAFFIQNGFRAKDKKLGLPVRPIGKGATVRITRSGDVIPHIVEVVKGVKVPDFPDTPYVWDGLDIVATQVSDQTINKRLVSFFSTADIDLVKGGAVQKLVDAGLDTIESIIEATVQDLQQVEGWKGLMAQKVWTAIHSKLDKIPLASLMDASGQFPAGMGTRRCQMVIAQYPDILDQAKLPTNQLVQLVAQVPGFAGNTALQFATGLPKFVIWLKRVKIKPLVVKAVKPSGSKCKGMSVCFTGVRSAELEATIVEQGGSIASGVTAGKTTHLIVKDPNSGSSKNVKAQQIGIPVLTIDQFKSKYKL